MWINKNHFYLKHGLFYKYFSGFIFYVFNKKIQFSPRYHLVYFLAHAPRSGFEIKRFNAFSVPHTKQQTKILLKPKEARSYQQPRLITDNKLYIIDINL